MRERQPARIYNTMPKEDNKVIDEEERKKEEKKGSTCV